jgi:hypothetical protein
MFGRRLISVLLAICFQPCVLFGAPDSTLLDAVDLMYEGELDSTAVWIVTNAEITHRDMRITIDSGMMSLFKPVEIAGASMYYGGIFEGAGNLQFCSPLAMERQQMSEFFKSDSLDRKFTSMLVHFDSATYVSLLGRAVKAPGQPAKSTRTIAKELNEYLRDYYSRNFYYTTLNKLLRPDSQYVTAVIQINLETVVIYQHDLEDREQVTLMKRAKPVGSEYYFQLVCSYPEEASDSIGDYNGIDRTQFVIDHYSMDAIIRKNGKFLGRVTGHFKALDGPLYILSLSLDSEMKVDSVIDARGERVASGRYERNSYHYGLWVLSPVPYNRADTFSLTFYYGGDVAAKELGEFFVFAGDDWYPRRIDRHAATFDLTFRTPAMYSFVSTGRLADSSVSKDTLITRWLITEPATNVSFNIGLFTRYEYTEGFPKPVHIYYSEDLHKEIGSSKGTEPSGSHMERQVGDDIGRSLTYFSSLFGEYPLDRIIASEILRPASTAYPGALHLGFYTWLHTDYWGFERMHRAHEVAHQWWGVGVSFESYRDQWLSEGFADYSALLYLQAVAGNNSFMDWLDEYRKEIVGERNSAGAIGLGYRVGNYKNYDHHDIITYKKGAYVLHMIRNLMMDLRTGSEDAFFSMLKEFYTTFRGKRATTTDFRLLVEKYLNADMKWFFDQWVYGSHVPTYKFSYQVQTGAEGGYLLRMRVEQSDVPVDFAMLVPVQVELETGGKAWLRYMIDKPVVERELPLPAKPKQVTFNPAQSVLSSVKQ